MTDENSTHLLILLKEKLNWLSNTKLFEHRKNIKTKQSILDE